MLDVKKIRQDFPILSRTVHGKPLVYLDNAATSQKPRSVIDALVDYYEGYNSNVHRGVHTLSMEATDRFEEARRKVATFINAEAPESVIWTRGATESINLVANTWAQDHVQAGDDAPQFRRGRRIAPQHVGVVAGHDMGVARRQAA